MAATKTLDFQSYLEETGKAVDRALDSYLPSAKAPPAKLHEAMRYAVFAGGKRFRPALVLLSCEAFGGESRNALPAACAIELIHTYSLIHDDLPCMDDAELRRGKPCCHKAFGEATGVLAGDALLTEAFGVLAKTPDAEVSRRLAVVLARAAGSLGMVGGQVEDLEGEKKKPELKTVEGIHLRKTAALISAGLEMGALCAGSPEKDLERIREFGREVGLAFQIVDDILDETGDAATLGKAAGQDAKGRKMTYPSCVGLEAARAEARRLLEKAQARVPLLGAQRTDRLLSLARFVLERVS